MSLFPRAAILSLLPHREALMRADAWSDYERAVLAGSARGWCRIADGCVGVGRGGCSNP